MTNLALKTVNTNAPPAKLLKKIHSLQKRGKFAESLPLCNRLAAQGYTSADLLHFHGLALRAGNDLNGALVKVYAATELKPDDALMLNSLGVILFQMNEVEAAIAQFKRATQVDQKMYDAWKNLGIALRKVERYQAAFTAFNCAHHLDRTQVDPMLNIVEILIDNRQYKRAEAAMDKLLAACSKITPALLLQRLHIAERLEDFDYIVAHLDTIDRSMLSIDEQAELDSVEVSYLRINGRMDEAIALLKKWVDVETNLQHHYVMLLGLCYAEAGQLDDGIAYHKTLLESKPDHTIGRYNLGLLQIKNGDLEEGYKNYEARWQRPEFPSKRRQFSVPRWTGEPLEGKKLLVWREQGIGDEVRYASIIADLQERGGAVTFECSPKLSAVWEHSFPWATIADEGPTECRGDDAYAHFDYQIPVGSLGSIFRPAVKDFDERQVPWIRRFCDAEQALRAQLAVDPGETLIGVCWRSSHQATSRDRYFLQAEQLEPLKALPNCRWVNVQYDCGDEEVQTIRDLGLPLHHYGNLDQKNDLVGACSLLGACDVVISVGVSVSDLAAGLGVPVIQIARENAEVFLGTDHVPWFPTCMSLRMKPHGGDAALAQIVERWPSILQWAKDVTTADRPWNPKTDVDTPKAASANTEGADLDLEFAIKAA
ncbi:tetratricopeptide repeat protein [Hoeflea poritis]|uniref:Tetratricopeptide repeat protein n=1 Tax=Hoeflea poritis TaxID=2993659 RepID=A0ABT4VVB1_9HYPH|nr:tetratricopeptide repeat protein [Hoeflea poritis]MDA4848644.1 tetratricopeptide repeat protein [Hoeflea poritis]